MKVCTVHPTDVPDKCRGPVGVGVTPNPCTEPGSLPRCKLCPKSPTYWRCESCPVSSSRRG